jgi:hypothetical protein
MGRERECERDGDRRMEGRRRGSRRERWRESEGARERDENENAREYSNSKKLCGVGGSGPPFAFRFIALEKNSKRSLNVSSPASGR